MTEAERVMKELLEKHIQRCRDIVASCPKWSRAQAEWSRARDALLFLQDDLNEALQSPPAGGASKEATDARD